MKWCNDQITLTTAWCNDQITLTTAGAGRTGIVLRCVLYPDHNTITHPHQSGTDPMIRWRPGWKPGVVDVWVDRSRERLFG